MAGENRRNKCEFYEEGGGTSDEAAKGNKVLDLTLEYDRKQVPTQCPPCCRVLHFHPI